MVPNACLFTIIDEPKENDLVSDVPTNPVSDILTNPVSDVPTDPVSDIPTNPVSDVPTNPVSDIPTNPVSDIPTNLVSDVPTNPVRDIPTNPVSDVPTDPVSLMQFFKEKLSSTIENDLSSIAKHLYFTLTLTDQECSVIEKLTRSQRESKRWFEYREGRLTASSFHSIYTLQKQTNPENLVQRILSAKDISHIPAVQWGINNENTARQEYIQKMSSHESLKYIAVGLVVNPLYPHLGASPDGIVHCSCCGKGLIEIKCPYSAKDQDPNVIRGKPQSCLTERGVSITHSYYTQIQGQLLITEVNYCDLVIWTRKGIIMERIYPDVKFTEKLLRKLTDFYVDNFLPKLLQSTLSEFLPSITQQHMQPQLYCFCQKEESGRMVMCDSPNCPYGWFHFECVGIKRAPAQCSSWFCSHCKVAT